ncbi:glycosyltransferase [Corynebacterium pacaense]|uniref:glycosyltransferase n=1 Tax=Corynebacterium pacaense TaxID=1816684 RepID=UPI0009B96925|nr:glycosyltransferase [Corynebacterium pacaense]
MKRTSARQTLDRRQKIILTVVAALTAVGLVFTPRAVALGIMVLFMVFQLLFVGLKVTAALRSRDYSFPSVREVPEDSLPRYTTLHPMYREANMIPLVVESMSSMDYPKDRLQCLLILEENDPETIEAARAANLPEYFEIVIVPRMKPYGKPKACNYALEKATGEMVVIFDAEDRPDPQQLRKAVSAIRSSNEPIGCVRARLVFENQDTTWVSRFLGNEYIVHFEFIMAGLAKMGLVLPLGGTSNHFPMAVLKELAFSEEDMPDALGIPAWDPYNVTEDADLGAAIASRGLKTVMFDSWTDEEAPVTVGAAFNQRTRWIKGYAQTSLALLKHPIRDAGRMGWLKYSCFLLTVGGTFLSLLLAPVFWAMTITYFIAKPQFIIALFPLPLFYTGLLLMVVGNLLMLYMSLVAALHRGIFSSVKYLAFSLFWWMTLSTAAYTSLLELVFPSWRPTWNKTAHGVVYVPLWKRLLPLASQHSPRIGILEKNQLAS